MGWKIGGVLSAILAGLAALITLTTAAEYKTGIEWVITLIFVLLAVLCFWRAAKASTGKKAKRAAAQQVFMTDQELEQIQAGVLPVLPGVPVILGEGAISRRRRRSAGPDQAAASASAWRRACRFGPAAGPVRRFTMTSRIPSSDR